MNLRPLYLLLKWAGVLSILGSLIVAGYLNPTEVGAALQAQMDTGPAGARNALLQQLQEQRGGGGRLLPGAVQAGER